MATPLRPFVLRYWPFLGAWPLIAALLAATPVALWLRHDAAPAAVSCTTGFPLGAEPTAKRVDASCAADDPNLLRSHVPLPCGAAAAALEGLLDRRNVFNRPVIHANVVELVASHPSDDRAEGHAASRLDADGARQLLLACAAGKPAPSGGQTVTVLVTGRDFRTSAGLLCAVCLLACVLSLRGRVTVRFDVAARLITVVERGFLWERRTALCPIDDVRDVAVATGAYGFLVGRRVELARHGGERIPLTEGYAPLTFRVHQQAARRLRAYLDGLVSSARS